MKASQLKPIKRNETFSVDEQEIIKIAGEEIEVAMVSWSTKKILHCTTALVVNGEYYCFWVNKEALFDYFPESIKRHFFVQGIDNMEDFL